MKKIQLLSLSYLTFLLFSCQPTEKTESSSKNPLFQLIPSAESGITFNNRITENFDNFFAQFNYVYNGGGVAVGDIDNDGLADIYFTGNEVENKLYLNKGDFQFEDITEKAKVSGGKGWHNGVTMVDVNADGYLDIYICRGGWKNNEKERENLLFINQQNGTFEEQAAQFGLADEGYSTQAAFFDMDNDGDLDMYLMNRPERFFLDYQKVLEGKKAQNDLYRDKLYRNDNQQFTEIGLASGIMNNFAYGLGIATADLNQDGFVDVYVANDYLENDYLYINQGDGTFQESIQQYTNHVPFYAMGVDAVDINNDGWEDLIELEMLPEDYKRSKTTMASMNTQLFDDLISNDFHHQYMHNMLQLNRGKVAEDQVFFSEIGQMAGIAKTDWSWSCLGSDFDNDGYRDIFITNGFRRDIFDKDAQAAFRNFMRSPASRENTDEQNAKHIISLFQSNQLQNYLYQNSRNLTFTNKAVDWGLHQKSFSNGAAVGDFDNDGDLDLVVNNVEGEAFLYRNKAEQTRNNYLKIKLNGSKENPFGLGAKITLKYRDEMLQEQIQYHDFKTTRGYLSSVEPIAHFGLGETTTLEEVKVQWLDGKVNILKKVAVNQTLIVEYSESAQIEAAEIVTNPLFKNVTSTWFDQPFIHQENIYDDYKDQVLLPHKFSQLGPCIAVADVNQDGLEDFYVGGASGQSGQLYLQDSQRFIAKRNVLFEAEKIHEDTGATFFDADGDGDLDLYVVSGGYEFPINSTPYQDRLYLNDGSGNFTKSDGLPVIKSSGACVVPMDFDKDGDLDLFVGGRISPKRYPIAPRSYLLQNENGKFQEVTEAIAPDLVNIGMVTDAIWEDLNQNGEYELIIVGEWLSPQIFAYEDGRFNTPIAIGTNQQFNNSSGWWNTLKATDYDADGQKELVLGNLGLNYKYKASPEEPFFVFADDFDDNGTNDVFLATPNDGKVVPIRGKECSSQQLPELKQKFKTYQQFAEADIYEILGKESKETLKYEAYNFASSILDFQDFSVASLPMEAQLSSVNGIIAEDFNDDGRIDLLLAGNKFESEIETTRADASIGLLLLQKESGTFQALPAVESGIFLPYNTKSLQTIRLGKERDLGVLVGNNNNELLLIQHQKTAINREQ
ncbi:MAG: VCBS repeat-containing protein [Bacteroidota bacterium]